MFPNFFCDFNNFMIVLAHTVNQDHVIGAQE